MTPTETTLTSERLRAETAAHHEAIERAAAFRRLGSDDFTQAEYVSLLERFYGFYHPLEQAFRLHPDITADLAYEQRFKLPLLARDLSHFGHTEAMLAALPRCEDLPVTARTAQALGAMYVMEGSTHGSQFIAKRLQAHFGLAGDGLAFYRGYGADTMPRWKAFKQFLDYAVAGEEAQADAVAAAARTFEALHRWMDVEIH